MPLKNVVQGLFADANLYVINSFNAPTLIDASGEKCAVICQVPKTGSITHVGFRTGAVTTPQTLRVGIETLSSGNPSTTQYGGSAVGTQTSPAANTYYEVALATPATAVRGDFIALVVQFNATVGNLEIAHCTGAPNHALPFVDEFVAAAWGRQVRLCVASLKYSDGSYPTFFCVPMASISEINFNSSSTPDERALKFKMPVQCMLQGVYMRAAMSSPATADIVLYDDAGNTLKTLSVSQANIMGTFNDPVKYLFPAGVTLKANRFYRLAYKPTSTTDIWMYQFTVNSAGMLDGFIGGQNWYLSTRTDAGTWTDTTTTRPYIGLIFEQFHDGYVSDYITL